ncbi:hypothetical protein LPJ53_004463 [Coemansia erecta]|uniref:Uncharacterized protein n=1 Tax=Coemansia erecta TaxID=147472 RepID=A0A9W7XYW2_9FUNG|nr:hypothetical protein LPJ53_004463 [Coemansia erecta]
MSVGSSAREHIHAITVYTAGVCIDETTYTASCALGVFYSVGSRLNVARRTKCYAGGGLYAALEAIRSVLEGIYLYTHNPREHTPVIIKTNREDAVFCIMNPRLAPAECRVLAKFVRIMCVQCSHPVSIEAYGMENIEMGASEAVRLASDFAQRR